MLAEKDKKRYNMLLFEARFLKAKIVLNQDVLEEAQEKFAEAYNEVCKTVPEHEREVLQGAMEKEEKVEQDEKKSKVSKAGQKAKEKRKTKKENKQEEIFETKKNPESKSMKKIYRAIARESHPDKLTGATEEEIKNKEKLFKEAQEASQDANLVSLIEIAENLNIKPPEPELEHIEILQKNIKNLKEANKMMTDTTAWQWHKEKNPETKEAILIRYMQYIYTSFK